VTSLLTVKFEMLGWLRQAGHESSAYHRRGDVTVEQNMAARDFTVGLVNNANKLYAHSLGAFQRPTAKY